MFDYRKDYPINPKSSKHFAVPQKTLMVNIRKIPQDIPSFDGLYKSICFQCNVPAIVMFDIEVCRKYTLTLREYVLG